MSRYSLKQALAATRGAISSTARADIRYAKRFDVRTRLLIAMRALQDAEMQLRFAIRDALAARRAKSATRRAA